MKSYTCDHCGQSVKVVKIGAGKGAPGSPDGWATVRVSVKDGSTGFATFDLCSACGQLLAEFFQ